ncbi:hypothetical protein AAGX64_13925, partial [Staphylococcus aureus]
MRHFAQLTLPIKTSVRIPQNDISRYVNEIVPTYIVCRNWESNFSLLGPTPQLALPVEFLFEILCVGA